MSSSTTTATPKRRGLSADLSDSTLQGWLRDMLLIREFEVRCAQAYQQAKIGGFCHLYIGQEACAVGTIRSINHDDPIITAYRDHGHALARGMNPGACMAEMFGKITGCAKGKGGSMHMFDKPNHNYGGHGIVGAQTPVGLGLAFATRYEWEVRKVTEKRRVCLAYLGDGALNQGALHEAMNLSNLPSIQAPVIFVVENNRYSMGTSIERGTTMAHNLAAKAAAYGMEALTIKGPDGGPALDVLDVYDRFKPFADECRAEQKPGFVDLHTYRYQGHSMSDPQKYRLKDEVEKMKESDSIASLAAHLMNERGTLSEDDYKAMNNEVKEQVRKAVEFAEASPVPEVEPELYSDVYANIQPNLSPTRDYTVGVKNPLL